ncbi:hypothetical protein ACQKKG_09455 [Brevundimonas sp. NPDC003935]|uniref:hypothetical protein n=1 Tax=unclassified Brevundimonas TaxID=2622653 RepID=UPI003684C12B
MIHAFNQKNVRRLLVRSRAEHGLEKTEDAVTSMVFSPLDFMSAADALEALCTVTLHDRVELSGRRLLRHDLQLWPSGLTAKAWNDDGHSRCEPDLLAKFEFADGPDLVFIGEMKWDWRMPKDALAAELRREREAVRRLHPRADLVLFVISKHRLPTTVAGASTATWTDVAGRLLASERSALPSAVSRWAGLVRTFLKKADQTAFSGLPTPPPVRPAWLTRPIFRRILE